MRFLLITFLVCLNTFFIGPVYALKPVPPIQLSSSVFEAQDLIFRQVLDKRISTQAFNQWLIQKHAQLQYKLDDSEPLRRQLFPGTIVSRNTAGLLLNNFKQKRQLNEQERLLWFEKEWQLYQRNKKSAPLKFELNYLKQPGLSSFDFVLFPDKKTVMISPISLIENPLKKMKGSHPNHTILAGQTPILSAGNMTVLNEGNKQLIFVSNKSGHFLPEYKDIDYFKDFLIKQGISSHKVFKISMASFYANTVYKYFYEKQLKISLDILKPEKVYEYYLNHWKTSFKQNVLASMLSITDNTAAPELTKTGIKRLKKDRKSAHYLRSAFYLFDRHHKPPAIFENYVIQYGKLNDGLIYKNSHEIKNASQKLREYLPHLPQEVLQFSATSKQSFIQNFQQNYFMIQKTLSQNPILLHDMHMMRIYYKQYLNLYKTMKYLLPYQSLVEVNIQHLEYVITHLGDLHDKYVEKSMNGEINYKDYQVDFKPKEIKYFQKVLNRAHQPILDK